jgi:hypothetical protein
MFLLYRSSSEGGEVIGSEKRISKSKLSVSFAPMVSTGILELRGLLRGEDCGALCSLSCSLRSGEDCGPWEGWCEDGLECFERICLVRPPFDLNDR